mmetsp:Transcript_40085/g.95974  ORF Transcript_40085/g.95974 Transcript_40085/m.95974 type:complete len:379 (+) Transcript_40085:603-1739(+)
MAACHQQQGEHVAVGGLAPRRAALGEEGARRRRQRARPGLARPAQGGREGGPHAHGEVGAPLVRAAQHGAQHVHGGAEGKGRDVAAHRRPRRLRHALRRARQGRRLLQVGPAPRDNRRHGAAHARRRPERDASAALDAQRALHPGARRGGEEGRRREVEADAQGGLALQEEREGQARHGHGQGVAAALVRARGGDGGGAGREHSGQEGQAHLLPQQQGRRQARRRGRRDPAQRDHGRQAGPRQDQGHRAPHHAQHAQARVGARLGRGARGGRVGRGAAGVDRPAQGGARRDDGRQQRRGQGAVDGGARRGLQARGDRRPGARALQHHTEERLLLHALLHPHRPQEGEEGGRDQGRRRGRGRGGGARGGGGGRRGRGAR